MLFTSLSFLIFLPVVVVCFYLTRNQYRNILLLSSAPYYNINTLFAVQLSEKFSPYIRYSYGLIDGELFRDENNDGIINAEGKTEGFDLGFNIISKLKNKDYNLMYGFEIGLDKIQIDDISDTLETVLTNRFKFPVEIITLQRFKNKNGNRLYDFEPFLSELGSYSNEKDRKSTRLNSSHW